jgi:deoxyribonuclease V
VQQSFVNKWDLSPDDAQSLQLSLGERVVREDRIPSAIALVAGVDVAYEKDGDFVFAAVVVLDAITLEVVETATTQVTVAFPYVPGLFSFRELPPLCGALQKLETSPDLIVCDGQGVAHPRRCGLASHLGLLFDVPTIGCGKTRLIGDYSQTAPNRGSYSDLVDQNEVIGSVLRTQDGVKPLFVSIGHRVSLPTARSWILRLAPEYRQPEPIRPANELVNQLRHDWLYAPQPDREGT